jgi:hypothetical protein
MIGITSKQKDGLLQKIGAEYFGAPISDKDQGVLADLLHTEPLLKALGRIKADTEQMAMNLVNANLGDEQERHQASVVQGIVRGRINTIEALLDLATLPEEEEDDEPATDTD